jgi:hypothetical protein
MRAFVIWFVKAIFKELALGLKASFCKNKITSDILQPSTSKSLKEIEILIAIDGAVKWPASWEPQEEGMMNIAASFSLSKKPRFNRPVPKKPNSRRWCLLASRQLWTIYRVPRPVLCFASCNVEPAHNTTKYFISNLRWGCQSHRFAWNKGYERIEWKAIVVCE